MTKLWETAKESLGFLAVCLGMFVALALLAKLLEKLLPNPRRAKGARYIAIVAMFSSIGAVLMMLDIPLFFAPGFYKLDLGELPVLLCSFYLGPVAGVITEFLKVLLKLLLKGTSTAFVGDFANFVVGMSFVLPASVIYCAKRSNAFLWLGLIVGTFVMTVFGSIFNALYLIPRFAALYGMELKAIVAMGTKVNSAITSLNSLVLYAVVPFNLLKGMCDSILTVLLYKRLEKVFFKA